jgi:hypothetical protein
VEEMNMADPHDWHRFDEEGNEVRQVTEEGEPNRWELRLPHGEVLVMNDEEFARLREGSE